MKKVAVFGVQKKPRSKTNKLTQKIRLSENYLIGYSIDKQIDSCDFFSCCDSIDFDAFNMTYEELNKKYVNLSDNYVDFLTTNGIQSKFSK